MLGNLYIRKSLLNQSRFARMYNSNGFPSKTNRDHFVSLHIISLQFVSTPCGMPSSAHHGKASARQANLSSNAVAKRVALNKLDDLGLCHIVVAESSS